MVGQGLCGIGADHRLFIRVDHGDRAAEWGWLIEGLGPYKCPGQVHRHLCGRIRGHSNGHIHVQFICNYLLSNNLNCPNIWTFMRSYEETITWLRYRIDLEGAPPSFWLILGGCAAEIRHLGSIPLSGAEARRSERNVLASGMHARLAMDGINLSTDQIEQHLSGKLRLPATQESAQLELDALLHAEQQIRHGTRGKSAPLTPDRIQAIHRTLTERSTEQDLPGQWRSQPLGSKPSDGVPPEVIGLFMEELCDWLNSPELTSPSEEETVAYALIRLLLAELYLVWIRPFAVGHARVSGIVAQYLLAEAGVGSTAEHLVAMHFHRHGREFQRQVSQASEGQADPIPFITYALRGLAEGLRELHERVRIMQTSGQWRAQLLDLFSDATDGPTQRQRRLLLDLGEYMDPVPLTRLPKLSTALANLYAGVSEKTLRRDVDALVSAGVLRKSTEGFMVERGNLLAFKH